MELDKPTPVSLPPSLGWCLRTMLCTLGAIGGSWQAVLALKG